MKREDNRLHHSDAHGCLCNVGRGLNWLSRVVRRLEVRQSAQYLGHSPEETLDAAVRFSSLIIITHSRISYREYVFELDERVVVLPVQHRKF